MVELVVEMELVMTVATVMLLTAMTEVVILVEETAGEKACVMVVTLRIKCCWSYCVSVDDGYKYRDGGEDNR